MIQRDPWTQRCGQGKVAYDERLWCPWLVIPACFQICCFLPDWDVIHLGPAEGPEGWIDKPLLDPDFWPSKKGVGLTTESQQLKASDTHGSSSSESLKFVEKILPSNRLKFMSRSLNDLALNVLCSCVPLSITSMQLENKSMQSFRNDSAIVRQ